MHRPRPRIFALLALLISTHLAADPEYVLLNYDYDSINLSNWHEPENRHFSYWNLEKLMPFPVEIGRGSLPVHEFGENRQDLSGIAVLQGERAIGLQEYFDLARVNGFLVVKNNDIAYEAYPRQMRRDDRHIVMSSSKSFVTAVMGNLVDEDRIDPGRTIDRYIPDVGPGYSGVTIQEALDMNAPIDWSEDYADPEAEGVVIFQAEAMFPGYEQWPGGARDFFRGLKQQENYVGGTMHYVTANASVLGWLLTEVTGISWNRLAQQAVWEKIGAEQNAMNFEDHTGYGQASGSFVMTLRDFARYAQIYANKGKAQNGERVFSESWFRTIVDNPDATEVPGSPNRYSHFIQIDELGALSHGGYGGQMWYANPETGTVIVQFGVSDQPGNANLPLYEIGMPLFRKIDQHLSR